MSRYIDAEKLLYDIEKYHLSDGKFQHWVEVQQTADVVEVKHGRWEYLYDGNYKCSECGSWWCCTDSQIDEMNFCPNCGAKMDEREEEQ